MKMLASTGRSNVNMDAADTLRDYGQFSYEACISLLYGKAAIRKGISNIEAFDYAFFSYVL